jgi:hypothetical protein
MRELGFHYNNFDEIWYLWLFRKSVKKIQVSLKSDKITGTWQRHVFIFMTISRWINLTTRNVSNKRHRENQNTHFMFSNCFRQRCRLLRGTFCPHSVFMCFVWIWEKTAIISLYSINWLVFITEMDCVYCAVRSAHTVCMCFVWIWEIQQLFYYTSLTDWFL